MSSKSSRITHQLIYTHFSTGALPPAPPAPSPGSRAHLLLDPRINPYTLIYSHAHILVYTHILTTSLLSQAGRLRRCGWSPTARRWRADSAAAARRRLANHTLILSLTPTVRYRRPPGPPLPPTVAPRHQPRRRPRRCPRRCPRRPRATLGAAIAAAAAALVAAPPMPPRVSRAAPPPDHRRRRIAAAAAPPPQPPAAAACRSRALQAQPPPQPPFRRGGGGGGGGGG